MRLLGKRSGKKYKLLYETEYKGVTFFQLENIGKFYRRYSNIMYLIFLHLNNRYVLIVTENGHEHPILNDEALCVYEYVCETTLMEVSINKI